MGSSPTVSWSACRSTQGKFIESSALFMTYQSGSLSHVCCLTFLDTSSATHPSSKANLVDDSCGPDSLWPASHSGETNQRPEVSFTGEAFQSSPPPPPPKRHCRSLSVPEDLSRCRSTWHPSASKVWTPVKRGSQSGGASSSGSGASSLPLCGPSSSFTSSSLNSSSSPTFFSLALSSDSPLPWSFPWDPCDKLKGACSASFASPSSCSSSPAPLISHSLLQRRFSLSPVHIQDAPVVLLPPRPSPASALTYGCSSMEHPALSPSPTSACSTPSSSRRDLHPALPRCHSQPCDMRKPRLKRRHDPDVLPCARPGLDFSKMTQVSNKVQWSVKFGDFWHSLNILRSTQLSALVSKPLAWVRSCLCFVFWILEASGWPLAGSHRPELWFSTAKHCRQLSSFQTGVYAGII